MDEKIKGIYIDLDSIFDTRLGCIAEIEPELVKTALDQGFLNRKADVFSFLKDETFKQLYDSRNADTLKVSPYTQIFDILNVTCNKMLKNAVDSPDLTGVKIYLNIHPFKLSDEEIGDLLELMVDRTKKLVQVQIVDYSKEELTLSFCKKYFDVLFMYDYNNFLEYNVSKNEHKKNTLYDRILIAPELYYREFSKSELDAVYRKNPLISGKSVAEIMKITASPIVVLELIEAKYFSVDTELYKKDFYKAPITEAEQSDSEVNEA